jgi:integrase
LMAPDMPRPRYPHLHQETHRGVRYWYFRIGQGKRIRIRGEYGSPEFIAAYRAALSGGALPARGEPQAHVNTLGWLIARFKDSGEWAASSEATKRQRENILKAVAAGGGQFLLSSITKAAIAKGRDKRSATPAAANNYLKTMRALFRWAAGAGLVDTDPTQGVAKVIYKTDGHAPWTGEDIAAFEARWPIGTRERLALAIFVYTGLRRGDASRLGRQHIRDGVITLRTEKTGELVVIPIRPEFQRIIDASPKGDLTLVTGSDGRPMTKESFGNWFGDACRKAGIRGKSAHGLRKYAATFAAERGTTEAELDAIFGWRGGRMASFYTRSANRARLAREAMDKLGRKE